MKFFERQHIRDLVALLRFVYNPADAQAWERIAVLLPKVGEKGAQKIHAAALHRAKALQKDFVDVLGAEDVRAKVAKDAKGEWDALVVSLAQVSEAMQDGDALRRRRDGDRGLVRGLPEGRVRRLHGQARGIEGPGRLRPAL